MFPIGIVEEAKTWATQYHAEQMYGDVPYTHHLQQVVDILQTVNATETELAVGWLHDILEDTPVDVQQLEQTFGKDITECVRLLTDPPGKNRKERKQLLYERLYALDERDPIGKAVLLVKLADRLANVRNTIATSNRGLLSMYAKEYATFCATVHRNSQPAYLWEEFQSYRKDFFPTTAFLDKE